VIVPFTPIRVFLVDDSPLALALLKRMLETSPDIEIVGTARNGREALAMFPGTKPKVILTDYQMPVMDGLALVRETMVVYPRPILVVSSLVNDSDHAEALPLLAAGAVDVFPKPSGADPFDVTAQKLVHKVKLLAGVFVVSRRPAPHAPVSPLSRPSLPAQATATYASTGLPQVRALAGTRIVTIGASTGGPQTINSILSSLPGNFPSPIICVQHISVGFLHGLVSWLDQQCKLHVKIAEQGERASSGTVYFPPENAHLEVLPGGLLNISRTPPVGGHRPAVEVLFSSVAKNYGRHALSILLTGMGSDGAQGLLAVSRAGGVTIAQSEASCVVFGMPKQAIDLDAAAYVLSPDEIRSTLEIFAASARK
jgi:two-component system chemotaxis response regulator CheB